MRIHFGVWTKGIRIAGGILGLAGAIGAGGAWAQAPAGPLPAAQPQPPSSADARPAETTAQVAARTSILGTWKLNRDESDDARKKMQDARDAERSRSGGGRGGVRMGIPGMGGGPYGGRRSGNENENEGDREKMQGLLNPAGSVVIAQKEAEVDLTEDQSRRTILYTDGRKVQKSRDAEHREVAAHWDGKRLVTDEKSPRGGKMSRTYELSYDGRQMYETLKVEMGRSGTQANIRYVYEQASETAAPSSRNPQ
jgi:hypothetical protein